MKRIAIAITLTLLVAPLAGAMTAEELHGTIIDTACYAADKHGPEQEGCTEMCLNMGVPPSMLTSDGEVVLLLPVADGNPEVYAGAKEMGSQEVTVTGMVGERGGLKVIFVETISTMN